MKGAERRMIKSSGKEYTIRNASGTSGGRDIPNYTDDGTLWGVLGSTSPSATTDSAGTEIEADLEIRAVYDTSSTTIRGVGESGQPSKLVHPNGTVYRVLDHHDEDGGVTVLSVARE